MPVARQFRSNTWMGGTGGMWSEVNLSGGESRTAVLGEYLICDVTAGDITITLPDEVIGGDIFPIRRVGSGNSVIIQGSGNNIENPSDPGNWGATVSFDADNATIMLVFQESQSRWNVESATAGGNTRPLFDTGITDIYVDSVAGDDGNSGESGSPYASIERALLDVPINNSDNITIHLAGGTYEQPAAMVEFNRVTFQGTTSDGDVATVSSVFHQSNARGYVVDVTGPNVAADELKGQRIEWTSGAASGDGGWIYGNDATGAGTTRIYMTSNTNTTLPTVTGTDTFKIVNLDTTVLWNVTHDYQHCHSLIYNDCAFDNETTFATVTFTMMGRFDLRRCYIGAISRIAAGRGGHCRFWDTYVAAGGNPLYGVINVSSGNVFLRNGTVVDGSDGVAANKYIYVDNATLRWLGLVVFRKIRGIRVENGNIQPITTTGVADSFFFEDYLDNLNEGIRFNEAGERTGGFAFLPKLHGNVTTDYVVKGRAGVHINLTSGSTCTSVVDFVSADDGGTISYSNTDGTIVSEDYVPYDGMARVPYRYVATVTGTHTAKAWEWVDVDPSAGPTINLPASPRNGESVFIKNPSADYEQFTVNGNGNNIEDNGGTYSGTRLADGIGLFLALQFMNSQWHVTTERRANIDSVMVFHEHGTFPTGTRYFSMSGSGIDTSEDKAPLSTYYILKHIHVKAATAPGAGNNTVFTVRKNGVDTAMTVTLSETNTEAEYSTAADWVKFEDGDEISVSVVSSAGAATAEATMVIEFY